MQHRTAELKASPNWSSAVRRKLQGFAELEFGGTAKTKGFAELEFGGTGTVR